jgi:formamidopyrimidine-DNA glycosylase
MLMLEIPESNLLSLQLRQTIKGKIIKNVYADKASHRFAFYFKDPNEYHKLLKGKVIEDVIAIAGQVEISAENAKILFADGINVRYFDTGEKIPEKHQLHIEFEDLSSIVCTVQMYGVLYAFKDAENDNPYYIVAKEKPSPLSDEFDRSYFDDLMSNAKPTMSVKAFLATDQRIPGVGNGVLQDILFNSKINPKSKIQLLSSDEKTQLFISLKETLLEMTSKGGRDTEKDLFGCNGGYSTKLSNKTLKNPCPICGDTIIRQAYLGGNVYYCPNCQPIKIK